MILKLILKLAVPIPKLTSFENYLFIGPHPDDIEIGAGGTAAYLASLGKKVTFLICTDGRYGSDKIEPDDLVEIRKNEAIAAAKHLGVNDVIFLPFSDGGQYDVKDLTTEIAKIIATVKPDVVFCPDPELKTELHPDHLNAGRSASNAFISVMAKGLMAKYGLENHTVKAISYYYTNRENSYVKLKGFKEKALEAIALHVSQFPQETPEQIKTLTLLKFYLKMRSLKHGLRRFCLSAEGFCTLPTFYTHCAPEAEDM